MARAIRPQRPLAHRAQGGGAGAEVRLSSIEGHDAFLVDYPRFNAAIRGFLDAWSRSSGFDAEIRDFLLQVTEAFGSASQCGSDMSCQPGIVQMRSGDRTVLFAEKRTIKVTKRRRPHDGFRLGAP
jgi:hypothetical protein